MAVRTIVAELLFDAHAVLGEGPIWDASTSRLLWLDIDGHRVHLLDPRNGDDRAYDAGARPGAAAVRTNGGVVIAMEHGVAALDTGTGAVRHLLDVEPETVANRMNDGKCDAAGRFWAGTMCISQDKPSGALYQLGTDGAATKVLDGVTISNGLAWSADNRTFYYIDTPTRGVDTCDFDLESGRISNRRRLVDVPADAGFPDGMTIDADGCLWVALWSGHGLHRYTPDGRLDAIVTVPAEFTTSATFGGDGYEELFITSAGGPVPPEQRAGQPRAGGVFVCRPGVRGVPAYEYGG
jgi:sugar lactone lactonase YvrE